MTRRSRKHRAPPLPPAHSELTCTSIAPCFFSPYHDSQWPHAMATHAIVLIPSMAAVSIRCDFLYVAAASASAASTSAPSFPEGLVGRGWYDSVTATVASETAEEPRRCCCTSSGQEDACTAVVVSGMGVLGGIMVGAGRRIG